MRAIHSGPLCPARNVSHFSRELRNLIFRLQLFDHVPVEAVTGSGFEFRERRGSSSGGGPATHESQLPGNLGNREADRCNITTALSMASKWWSETGPESGKIPIFNGNMSKEKGNQNRDSNPRPSDLLFQALSIPNL